MLNKEQPIHSSSRVFWYSALAAVALHITVIFVWHFISPVLLDRKDKTIPVLLISADSKTSKPLKSSSANNAATQDYLSTIEKSDFITHEKNETMAKRAASSNSPEISSGFPSISTPEHSQATRAQKARQGLKNIFTQQQQEQTSEIKQVSTRPTKQLDAYEQLLIKRLVKAEFYDRYHEIMDQYGKKKVDFEIVLTLFQNGAIKNADINKSSHISEIDELAVRTAFQASPYPVPPKKDIEKDFKYTIPISYHKKQE